MRRCSAFLALTLVAGPALAVNDAATRFLLVPSSARPAGLAGASTVLAMDADAARGNPAGLASLDRPETLLTHTRYVLFVKEGEIAFGMPTPVGHLGLHAAFMQDDQEGRDDEGHGLRYFSNRHATAAVAGGWRLAPAWSAGLALRYVQVALADAVSMGGGLDAGVAWEPPAGAWRAGLTGRNLGLMRSFAGAAVRMPALVEAGVARRLGEGTLTMAADGRWLAAGDVRAALGAEWRATRLAVLRAGAGARRDSLAAGWFPELALGIGLGVDRWGLDYATTPLGAMGAAHRFTFRATY